MHRAGHWIFDDTGLGYGEPLDTWAFSDDEVDAQVLAYSTERSGAVVMGRRLCEPESIRLALDFTFVTDELVIHLAPILLGAGTPLFTGAARRELQQREVRVSPYATHLTYDIVDVRPDG